jgi:flagellar hook-associated protein 1 FlgK
LGGAGTLALTDGVLSFSAASSSNGVVIADDEASPTDRGGRGFSHFFGMNDLINGDELGIYETGLAGTEDHNLVAGGVMEFRVTDASGRELDTVTVTVTGTSYDDMIAELNSVTGLGAYFTFSLDGNGALSWTENSSYDGSSFQVTSDNTEVTDTGLTFTQVFGIGDRYRVEAAKDMQVNENVADNPDLLALSIFDTTGSIGDVVLTSGDQRGALALQDLQTSLVSFEEAGELKATNVTLTQYVARFLGNAGLQAVRASNFEEDNLALQQEISSRSSDISGVNLDEELSNLVVYQNAYNAAARILSTVQELYDSLLSAV